MTVATALTQFSVSSRVMDISWLRWHCQGRHLSALAYPYLNLHTPAQARGLHGRIPQLDHIVIHLEHGDGCTGHFKAGDIGTNQVAHYFETVFLCNLIGLAIDDVELDQRSPAH